jgi:hypothetical protein
MKVRVLVAVVLWLACLGGGSGRAADVVRVSGGKDFHFVEKKVAREQLFDLSVAKEAKARLDREKPFGN